MEIEININFKSKSTINFLTDNSFDLAILMLINRFVNVIMFNYYLE